MLKYREFLDLTDEEIEFILKDIFHCKKVENIYRDKKFNHITVEITTIWDTGEEEDSEIVDEITLTENSIDEADFSLVKGDLLKWKQFLLAKGCDYRLKDNPYMEEQE